MKNAAKTPTSGLYLFGLGATLAALFVHAYLALRHFELNFGNALGESLCNIGETFNCDAVAVSSYSSLFGIPLALWGAVTSLVLLIMMIFYKWTWESENSRLGPCARLLAAISLLASIVMGTISVTQLNVYCPFCILAYALSLISFIAIHKAVPSPFWSTLVQDISALFSTHKSLASYFIAIPCLAWILNGMLLQRYEVSSQQIASFVKHQVANWKLETPHDFSSAQGLALGAPADQAKMTIHEFADFRCGHCKNAAPKLHAFTKSHKDVRLVFLAFPLDGSCNPAIARANQVSCRLAKAAFCGDGKSWKVHDYIFARQREFSSPTAVDSQLEKMALHLNLDWPSFKECLDAEETHNKVRAQAQLGQKAGVEGTPSIYVNGQKLIGGQMIQILQGVYEAL